MALEPYVTLSVFWLAQLACDTKSDRPPCFVLRKGPSMPKTELKRTERGAQHCTNGRPTPVCDPYRPSLKYSVTHSSSMKGPRLNFHAERDLAHPKTTFFSSFLQLQYPHVRRRRVVRRYSKKQVTHRQLVLRYRYCTLL